MRDRITVNQDSAFRVTVSQEDSLHTTVRQEDDFRIATANADTIRDLIKHENSLLNNRFGWLLTCQIFLFAAIGVSWGKEGAELFWVMIPLVGLVISLVTVTGVSYAHRAIEFQKLWWEATKDDSSFFRGKMRGLWDRRYPGVSYEELFKPEGSLASPPHSKEPEVIGYDDLYFNQKTPMHVLINDMVRQDNRQEWRLRRVLCVDLLCFVLACMLSYLQRCFFPTCLDRISVDPWVALIAAIVAVVIGDILLFLPTRAMGIPMGRNFMWFWLNLVPICLMLVWGIVLLWGFLSMIG